MNSHPLIPRLFLAGLLLAPFAAASAQTELISDGTFATNATGALYDPQYGYGGYSLNVASYGTTPANYQYNLTQTIAGNAGWVTNEPNGASPGQFEIWNSGTNGAPVNSTASNTAEISNLTGGDFISQTTTSLVSGGTTGTLSFGYFARNSGGIDGFQVSVVDLNTMTRLVLQSFNPTVGFQENQFSTQFAITPGDQYSVTFQDTGSDGNQASHIDDVSLMQSPVPEPGTYAMLLVGAGALLVVIRRSHNPSARVS